MYRVEPIGDEIVDAVDNLPHDLLVPFSELRAALEVSPRTVGRPWMDSNPDGMRVITAGPDGRLSVVFGVIDRDRLVTLISITFV